MSTSSRRTLSSSLSLSTCSDSESSSPLNQFYASQPRSMTGYSSFTTTLIAVCLLCSAHAVPSLKGETLETTVRCNTDFVVARGLNSGVSRIACNECALCVSDDECSTGKCWGYVKGELKCVYDHPESKAKCFPPKSLCSSCLVDDQCASKKCWGHKCVEKDIKSIWKCFGHYH
ncbi:unnamed protein product [Chondrus crispus]|uniref:Uncharacterized protein n=1 Tax=Chondrus crispus TaxID=2769 RepID=R7QMJ2_CHOCR|nr:unnamed protein product [Chondrus crispus]CDF38701.1 unnamed protein product [Chondrus crispus]|eukprot:XP_005718606.1 unnamed protein product [Chondrus crispus]